MRMPGPGHAVENGNRVLSAIESNDVSVLVGILRKIHPDYSIPSDLFIFLLIQDDDITIEGNSFRGILILCE